MNTIKKSTTPKAVKTVSENVTAKTEVSTILNIWSKSDKDRNSDELSMSFKELKADAEQTMLKFQKEALTAEKALNNTLANSMKNPDFKAISESMLDVEAAKLRVDRAVDAYVFLFGTTPSIAI